MWSGNWWRRLLCDDAGQDLIEFSLLLALLATCSALFFVSAGSGASAMGNASRPAKGSGS
jgi:hypothetical protein